MLSCGLKRFCFVWLIAGLQACGGGSSSSSSNSASGVTGSPSTPSIIAPARFSDVTVQSNLMVTNGFSASSLGEIDETAFANGVAAADYDDDGNIDLFIARGDLGPNLLYRNLGNMQFEEVAQSAGIAFTKSETENYRHGSPAFADLDGDNDLDILLTGLESDPTLIYINNGDGTFSDVTQGSGLDEMTAMFSHSPAFGDYDLDGDIDLILAHWGTPLDMLPASGDTQHLWRNDSDSTQVKFSSVSLEAGIAPSIHINADTLTTRQGLDFTLTPTFVHLDADRYPDLVFSADFNYSQVYSNMGNGTFANITDYSVIIDGNGMGATLGDYDNDGDQDWFVGSILANDEALPTVSQIGNRLYRNNDGIFEDVTAVSGVADGGWAWGSCFADFNNDGNLDIYHTNGFPGFDQFGDFTTDQSRLFISNGNGTFTDQAQLFGLNDQEQGRGIVCADFDNDGNIDILQMTLNDDNAVSLYRNENGDVGHYIKINLRGEAPNTQAIGARITVSTGGRDQYRDVMLGSNYLSHNPTEQMIGLNDSETIELLTVDWPDGQQSVLSNVGINQSLEISHPDL